MASLEGWNFTIKLCPHETDAHQVGLMELESQAVSTTRIQRTAVNEGGLNRRNDLLTAGSPDCPYAASFLRNAPMPTNPIASRAMLAPFSGTPSVDVVEVEIEKLKSEPAP